MMATNPYCKGHVASSVHAYSSLVILNLLHSVHDCAGKSSTAANVIDSSRCPLAVLHIELTWNKGVLQFAHSQLAEFPISPREKASFEGIYTSVRRYLYEQNGMVRSACKLVDDKVGRHVY